MRYPPTVRWLFFRPSPELRKRCAIASAHMELPTHRYCRHLIENWLCDEARVTLSGAPDECGPYCAYRYPVTSGAHRNARVISADLEISASTLVIRILHAFVPFEVEVLADAMGAMPRIQTSP